MKVLHLTTHLNTGGITIYVLKLIRPLSEQGIETFVLSSGGEWSQRYEKEGAKVFTFNIKTKAELNPKLYLQLPQIAALIRANKIDILHAHTRITQVMAYWLSRMTGVKVVTTCHGFFKRRFGRRLLPAWGNTVIAISQMVAYHLHTYHAVDKSKIELIHNAVNIQELETAYRQHDPQKTKATYGFKKDDPVVGIISRIIEDKGHSYLIHAVKSLKSEFPNLKILIVGDGKFRKNLEKIVRENNLQNDTFFTGNIEDVTIALAAMDIFVLPATLKEGFGLSLAEAMACHKPTIVTDIWALNTIIQNNINGLIVPPKDHEALAHAIRNLLLNPELANSVAQNARKLVESQFSIQRMTKQICQVYQKISETTGT